MMKYPCSISLVEGNIAVGTWCTSVKEQIKILRDKSQNEPVLSLTNVVDSWAMFTHDGLRALCFTDGPTMCVYDSRWHEMIVNNQLAPKAGEKKHSPLL